MSLHHLILKASESLGYKPKDGCCHGFSIRWLEACLANEKGLFHERIQNIVSRCDSLAESVLAVKAKKGKDLTEEDRELIDIVAFFESLDLYHVPEQYFSFFNQPGHLSQQDLEIISDYASSDSIQSRGGLAEIYSELSLCSSIELKEFLNELALTLEESTAECVGIILASNNHSIALTYTPGQGWYLMDINHYPPKSFDIEQTTSLSEQIEASFHETSSGPAMNVTLLTTHNSPLIFSLQQKLEAFKKGHKITPKMIQHGADFAFIAAKKGDIATLEELALHQVELNKTIKEGFSSAYVAAQTGQEKVIELLAENEANWNEPFKKGITLAHIAAQNGHVAVIEALAKYKVNLNARSDNGATPTHLAAQNGYAAVIEALAKHQVNVNEVLGDAPPSPAIIAVQNGHPAVIEVLAQYADDWNDPMNDGTTLAHVAAFCGQVSVIEALAKLEVNLNAAKDDGSTPALIAIQYGQLGVIKELAKHNIHWNASKKDGSTLAHIAARYDHVVAIEELAPHQVNWSKPMNNGITPAFIAAQNGQVASIFALIKIGADCQAPFISCHNDLIKFASTKGNEVISRMSDFLQEHASEDDLQISMTPYDIAHIMGHQNVIALLDKAHNLDHSPFLRP